MTRRERHGKGENVDGKKLGKLENPEYPENAHHNYPPGGTDTKNLDLSRYRLLAV